MPDRLTVLLAMRPAVAGLVLPPDLLGRLRKTADVHGNIATDFHVPDVRDVLGRADVLLTGWGSPRIDAAVLDRAPRLRAIVHAAGSVKGHVGAEAWARGISVTSAADANAEPVAQYTVGLITLAAKRAFGHAAAYRRGEAEDSTDDPGMGGYGRTVGIVGASRIGRLVLRRLVGFGRRLLLSDPTLDASEATALGAELVDQDKLFRESDIVSLHAPLLPSTQGMVDERLLSLLRDGAVVVNTARGALIDTEALTRHCMSGRIGAVLDVTAPEPLPAGHPLLSLPQVFVTPHLAGAMGSEIRLLGESAVSEVERLANERQLTGLVRKDDLYRIA
ncbi:hydroxyacid dehydrogenase [Streptomyces sp. NPDC005507]|uniref:hydroxyacid dehydrogenase n=1 Tax=unclassified Streptomyces TaxID=2593676 RepID=UPI0033A7A425